MKNDYEIVGDTVVIQLEAPNGDKYEALIDVKDLQRADQFSGTWRPYIRENKSTVYVSSAVKKNGKTTTVYLHRWINDVPKGKVTDHINHNGLDNRSLNLRFIDNAENGQNRSGIAKHNKSGVTGVCWNTRDKRWRANIQVNKKSIYIGHFTDLKDAERAVTEARKKYHPYSQEASV